MQQQAGNTAMYLFGLAEAFVFVVVATPYESWLLSLSVILVVPMCRLRSVDSVLYLGLDVNIVMQISVVALAGWVCKIMQS